MLDSELAKELSSKGGIGLSSVLLHQLERKTDNIKE
jgi:Rod binding domain-containing protein